MSRPNVYRELAQAPFAGAGFRGRTGRVADEAGAKRLGASVYELAPGECLFPYHYHRANEELLVVLKGQPILRTPDGERELREGEVAAFRAGPAGAHQVLNRGSEPARYIVFSTKRTPDCAGYPDSGKVGVLDTQREGEEAPFRAVFRIDDQVGYFDGEEAPR